MFACFEKTLFLLLLCVLSCCFFFSDRRLGGDNALC